MAPSGPVVDTRAIGRGTTVAVNSVVHQPGMQESPALAPARAWLTEFVVPRGRKH